MPEAATLRPVTAEDRSFLEKVYASTRMEELSVTGWTPEQKSAFCLSQFNAQTNHYLLHYPNAEFSVIEHDEIPVGRLYVDRWTKEIRIIDISLLPKHRGKGIGSQFLRVLQQEASDSNRTLSIHVEKFNPARRLYERFGFQEIEDKGVYILMEWSSRAVST